jgi:signal transduction histidine kinase
VAVRDSGPGVAPQLREHIFDRLFRGDHRGGQSAGAGLGLPIARGFARAHGGDVTCEPSPPGAGAVFVLTLPGAR